MLSPGFLPWVRVSVHAVDSALAPDRSQAANFAGPSGNNIFTTIGVQPEYIP